MNELCTCLYEITTHTHRKSSHQKLINAITHNSQYAKHALQKQHGTVGIIKLLKTVSFAPSQQTVQLIKSVQSLKLQFPQNPVYTGYKHHLCNTSVDTIHNLVLQRFNSLNSVQAFN